MKHIVIISLLLFTFGDIKAAHVDRPEKQNIILKENSSSKIIADFYRKLNNVLDIRLIYAFKLRSQKTYANISDLMISANNTKKERGKLGSHSLINIVSKNIIQQLREDGAGVSFLDKDALCINNQKISLADFYSINDEYRALFDVHIQIKYEPLLKDFLINMQKCLSDLKLERHVIAFINFKHELKYLKKKFINFNKKYSLILNLLAINNRQAILNDDKYIYFLDEISTISELIMSWDKRRNQLFSHISPDDWTKIAKWQLIHKKFMPTILIDFQTDADFCCYTDK